MSFSKRSLSSQINVISERSPVYNCLKPRSALDEVRGGKTRQPTWLPLCHIDCPEQAPQEHPQNQENTKKQDPEIVHNLDFVNNRLGLRDLEKFYLSGPNH